MNRQLKVGIFVTAGIVLFSVTMFLIGDGRRVWDRKVQYQTTFKHVAGLKPGAPVRMGGYDIGTVKSVGYAESQADALIHVTLSVSKVESVRVRADSLVTIAGKGLLGDKMIEVTIGSGAVASDGATLRSEEPADLFASAKSVADNADVFSKELADEKFRKELRGTMESLHTIVDGVAHQDGTLHRLIYDKEQGKKIDELVGNLAVATRELQGTTSNLRQLTERAKTGPGPLHTLLYDDTMGKNLGATLEEIRKDLEAIRTGNGLAHSVIYGDDETQKVMSNLNTMSDDLKVIVANLKAGKGTIGALLVDPSVYEDVKSIVGNVERNQVLRALVRYSIKADENAPHVVTPPK